MTNTTQPPAVFRSFVGAYDIVLCLRAHVLCVCVYLRAGWQYMHAAAGLTCTAVRVHGHHLGVCDTDTDTGARLPAMGVRVEVLFEAAWHEGRVVKAPAARRPMKMRTFDVRFDVKSKRGQPDHEVWTVNPRQHTFRVIGRRPGLAAATPNGAGAGAGVQRCDSPSPVRILNTLHS